MSPFLPTLLIIFLPLQLYSFFLPRMFQFILKLNLRVLFYHFLKDFFWNRGSLKHPLCITDVTLFCTISLLFLSKLSLQMMLDVIFPEYPRNWKRFLIIVFIKCSSLRHNTSQSLWDAPLYVLNHPAQQFSLHGCILNLQFLNQLGWLFEVSTAYKTPRLDSRCSVSDS